MYFAKINFIDLCFLQENVAKWGPSPRKYRFMVSVSLPVFDQRNTTEHLVRPFSHLFFHVVLHITHFKH